MPRPGLGVRWRPELRRVIGRAGPRLRRGRCRERRPAQAAAGIDAVKADAAGQSLRRKRARTVAQTWPGLAASLDDAFAPRFDEYARALPPPAWGGGLTDGLAFARGLPAADVDDQIRIELLFARADIVPGRRGRPPRKRRGVFAAALLLQNPRRILIALRTPRLTHALSPPRMCALSQTRPTAEAMICAG
jgi:hypothetical protein